ncbi:MAG: endonuclease/exonuclease/phosphatase family protein [Lachnospiraceae bacterium]|nr:endonuclease/exonuclease/phosphatase family protein [Lachnospiraceae bacterium]
MKIVTFNIRCDYQQDKANNFCFRRPLIAEKLQQEKPDMICFQEVLPHVALWLKEELTDYYVIGCGRSETLEDEQTAIAYWKDRLNLIQMETYWLSETPYTPASRYPDQSICPRVCTEAVFEDLATKTVFRAVNTHLDHEGPKAREEGLRQIMEKVESAALFPKAPVIFTGDMNAEPDSAEMAVMEKYPYVDVAREMGITYHGYGRAEDPCHIDYIFVRGFVCESVEKWTEEKDGVFLSDHYPVCAVLHPSKT